MTDILFVSMLFHNLLNTSGQQDVERCPDVQTMQPNVPLSMLGFLARHHTVSGFPPSYKSESNQTLQQSLTEMNLS
jgi:hypothetical protein